MKKEGLTHSSNQIRKKTVENKDISDRRRRDRRDASDVRDDEIIQAVCEHHVDKLALGPGGSNELGRRQYEDSKVEDHAVDECGGEKLAVRRGNKTSLTRNPCRGQ
jgi:hypothetical protein